MVSSNIPSDSDSAVSRRKRKLVDGTNGKDVLRGTSGDDRLDGLAGLDRLLGLGGRDRLSGGNGADTLLGGGDNDRLSGDRGNDVLDGGGGQDKLLGSSGQDTLTGGGGKDTLNGGRNDDLLRGGSGSDRLTSGGGNDVLVGGLQADILTGGLGKDRFVYQSFSEGGDIITDFNTDRDVIDLSPILGSAQFKDRYTSSDPFKRYVVAVKVDDNDLPDAEDNRTIIRVDVDGDKGDKPFKTLVTLYNVDFEDVSAKNFIF